MDGKLVVAAKLSSTLTNKAMAVMVEARKLEVTACAPALRISSEAIPGATKLSSSLVLVGVGRHPPIQANLAKMIEQAAENTQYGQDVCKTPKSRVIRKIENVPMPVVMVVRAIRFQVSSSSSSALLNTIGCNARAAVVT